MTKKTRLQLGAAIALAALVAASVAAAATPRPLSLDVTTPSLGKLRLGQPASAYERLFGDPDDVQMLPTGPIMSWYTKAGLKVAVAFTDSSEQSASSIYYAAPLRTTKGDQIGTPLATFLKHWPNAEKADTWWSRSYHVASVWFHFSAKNRLYAVELGDRSVTLSHPPKK